MSKEKRFGDLKVGDVVFIADKKDWTVKPIKIIRVTETPRTDLIWIYLESGSNLHVDRESSYYEFFLYGVWTNQEEATKEMMRMAKEQEEVYINAIDSLISEYDALQKFMMEYEEKI